MIKLKKHNFFILSHMFIILLFASIYYSIFIYDNNSFNIYKNEEDVNYFDFLHFSLVTQTTVGYGDVMPIKNISRIMNFIQLLTIYGIVSITILI